MSFGRVISAGAALAASVAAAAVRGEPVWDLASEGATGVCAVAVSPTGGVVTVRNPGPQAFRFAPLQHRLRAKKARGAFAA